MVLTSHGECNEKKTGWFLPELAHPYFRFVEAGYDIEIVSIQGGAPAVAPSSVDMNDEENKKFWETPETKALVENTKKLSECNAADYDCIFYVGGFGVMWDVAFDPDVNHFGRVIYEKGGVVGAVCHGPIALANVTLSNGDCLIKNKEVAAFTDEEENAINYWDILPKHPDGNQSCGQVLKSKGGLYKEAAAWSCNVCVQDRVVSGQNPMSAAETGRKVVEEINKINK